MTSQPSDARSQHPEPRLAREPSAGTCSPDHRHHRRHRSRCCGGTRLSGGLRHQDRGQHEGGLGNDDGDLVQDLNHVETTAATSRRPPRFVRHRARRRRLDLTHHNDDADHHDDHQGQGGHHVGTDMTTHLRHPRTQGHWRRARLRRPGDGQPIGAGHRHDGNGGRHQSRSGRRGAGHCSPRIWPPSIWRAAASGTTPRSDESSERSLGHPVAVGPLLFEALEVACAVAAQTAGIVDPTIGLRTGRARL